MTEAEWLAAEHTHSMIESLDAHFRELDGSDGDQDPVVWWVSRKLRLWTVACCRSIEHLITDPRSRAGLDTLERYVDGECARGALLESARSAGVATWPSGASRTEAEQNAAKATSIAVDDITGAFDSPLFASDYVIEAVISAALGSDTGDSLSLAVVVRAEETRAQADLLREVFGNPFRPVALDPAWLTSDVRALAHAIYAERAFDRMPILADAFQEAGCENEDVLAHCRSATAPHVRGCWVIDLLLGRAGPR
jgi:hypothetical protein